MKKKTPAPTLVSRTKRKDEATAAVSIRALKKQGRFKRLRGPGPDFGIGDFFFEIEVVASREEMYIPLSVASGKKPTGFVYQIEGTGEGAIATTSISVTGSGVSRVLLGTIEYAKIPSGKTATFRILIEMRGRVGKEYRIVINRINYKYSSSDARYQKLEKAITSNVLKFR